MALNLVGFSFLFSLILLDLLPDKRNTFSHFTLWMIPQFILLDLSIHLRQRGRKILLHYTFL